MNVRNNHSRLPAEPGKAWIVCLICGAAVTALVAVYRAAGAYQEETQKLWFSVCDGAFVAAVLLIGLGLLIWIGSTGMFDTLTYAAHSLKHMLLPFGGKKETRPDYYHYKLAKEEKRRPVPVSMLGSGVLFLLLAGLALILAR